mmetsp:Transcript_74596/g.155540  ORF Transcript_74596/g.155540 Transcript_74596/m.155540 type:complete len:548 (+) Transcript_74596:102-1745(+)
MKKGFLGTVEKEPERLRKAREDVKEAEAELRRLRSQRIRSMGPPRTSDGTAGLMDLEVEESAAAASSTCDPTDLKPLPEAAVTLLIEMEQPPASVAHRLAELLTLLLKAPTLISLGQVPLPRSVPWENLQALLKRLTVTPPDSGKILAALREKPSGTRLRQHLLAYLSDGDVEVLRTEVVAEDPRLVAIYDFVTQMLSASQDQQPSSSSSSKAQSDSQDEAAAVAVAEQEKEVAQLRRKLKEVEKSEAAAKEFAERNAPKLTAPQDSAQEEALQTSKNKGGVSESKKLAKVKNPELVCARELQYRLGESGVPSMQEAILLSIEKLMNEPRINNEARQLHVLGRAEVREEPSLASERATAVETWFLERGLPSEAIKVETCPESERGNRRVELRLFGEAGGNDTVRSRAESLLARAGILVHEELQTAAQATLQVAASAAAAVAAASAEQEKLAEDAPALVTLDILPADSAGSRRGLKLVFSLAGHPASDVNLEISEALVRLSSFKENWLFSPLDVELPFKVEEATSGGARFSRKAGTLTLTLWESEALH